MIRKQTSPPALFYSAQEIARPAARNFYARLTAAVGDWAALAAPFAPAFSATLGRPMDPGVYLKIFLVGYLENIVYDTDLAERIGDSIAIREFLGYDLSEAPPDHSSISRNRAAIAKHCSVEEVLAAVVVRCTKAGLVGGEEAAVDGCLIPANASLSSLHSVTTGKSVREHLREVREKNRAAGEEGPKEKLTVSNEEFRSATDPDARLAKKRGYPKRMSYLATHVTDANAGIILAADCTLAEGDEPAAATPVLAAAQETLAEAGLALGTVVGDAGYDDSDFHAAVEELGATPLTNYQPDTAGKPDAFQKARFHYDADADRYQCPAGCFASYAGTSSGVRQYRTRAGDCRACPHRQPCIGAGRCRTITRQQHEESRLRNIARCHTDAGRAALRRRRHIVEPPFGHLKTYGGLSRINCRGRTKAKVKVVLAAVAWNLIKLVKAADHRGIPAPAGAVCLLMRRLATRFVAQLSVPSFGRRRQRLFSYG